MNIVELAALVFVLALSVAWALLFCHLGVPFVLAMILGFVAMFGTMLMIGFVLDAIVR